MCFCQFFKTCFEFSCVSGPVLKFCSFQVQFLIRDPSLGSNIDLKVKRLEMLEDDLHNLQPSGNLGTYLDRFCKVCILIKIVLQNYSCFWQLVAKRRVGPRLNANWPQHGQGIRWGGGCGWFVSRGRDVWSPILLQCHSRQSFWKCLRHSPRIGSQVSALHVHACSEDAWGCMQFLF